MDDEFKWQHSGMRELQGKDRNNPAAAAESSLSYLGTLLPLFFALPRLQSSCSRPFAASALRRPPLPFPSIPEGVRKAMRKRKSTGAQWRRRGQDEDHAAAAVICARSFATDCIHPLNTIVETKVCTHDHSITFDNALICARTRAPNRNPRATVLNAIERACQLTDLRLHRADYSDSNSKEPTACTRAAQFDTQSRSRIGRKCVEEIKGWNSCGCIDRQVAHEQAQLQR